MGAFYNSISIPGRHPEEVRRSLDRWLGMLGYGLSDEPALFDLDGDNERSVFVVYNQRWTLIFFSHYDEERRLIRELQSLDHPLLYVWVYDSDVWGYDVFTQQGFAGSFSSSPRDQISFPDEELGKLRPVADPKEICRLLGLPDLSAEIRSIEQRKAAYKEDVCRAFCSLIGAEAAVASYDDLECGDGEHFTGWQTLHLLYVRQRFDTDEIDLHTPDMLERPTLSGLPRVRGEVDLSPELLAEMERMRQRVKMTMMILKPASWVARGWRKLYETRLKWLGDEEPQSLVDSSVLRTHYRVDGQSLINDRHGCRVLLPQNASPLPASRKPSSVFAFKIDDVSVTCTARRLSKIDEVLRQPSGSKLLRDENFLATGHRARQFLFEMSKRYVAGSKEPSFLGMAIVQTRQGLYVFLYRYSHQPQEPVELKIRRVVESFELIAQGDVATG